ncbi:hypothetical protein CYCD_16450 [Tenuifilaceae bacterium CYCD]|nr:hypothetical protein CYCD_16450 [Tenuifilaceae bacterium CYCD]
MHIGKVATKDVVTATCGGTLNISVRIGRKIKPPPPPSIDPPNPIINPIMGNKKYIDSIDELKYMGLIFIF